jgi:DUF218 domain
MPFFKSAQKLYHRLMVWLKHPNGENAFHGKTESGATFAIAEGATIENLQGLLAKIRASRRQLESQENIQNVVPLLQSLEHDHTILVTSEWHMQRALGLFMRSLQQRGVVASASFVSSLELRPAGSNWENEACLLWKDLGRMAMLWQYPPRN